MVRTTTVLWSFVCLFTGSVWAQASKGEITLASYNIQALGEKKLERLPVIRSLARELDRYDVVAIQEVRAKDASFPERLQRELHRVRQNPKIDVSVVLGERVGRTPRYQEQYGFVWNPARVELLSTYQVRSDEVALARPPFIARFRVAGEGGLTFAVFNVHLEPRRADAIAEAEKLAQYLSSLRRSRKPLPAPLADEDDWIVVGDFNLEAPTLRGLFTHSGFAPHASTARATTLAGTRALDHFLLNRASQRERRGKGKAGRPRDPYGRRYTHRHLSDHWPVFMKLGEREKKTG